MIGGIICFVIGLGMLIVSILCFFGNIKMFHYYHIQNITEENRKPFARHMGAGLLIIALSIIASGVFMILYEISSNFLYSNLSFYTILGGVVIGVIILFFTTKKYNITIF